MAGMSLMEILIAMAIGLIGIVVITQTYLVNENYKRSTASAGGAQTSGALALYTIERDARMAGWGIAWSSVLGRPGRAPGPQALLRAPEDSLRSLIGPAREESRNTPGRSSDLTLMSGGFSIAGR
jgi:hypothetical protein